MQELRKVLLCFLIILVCVSAQSTVLDNSIIVQILRTLRTWIYDFLLDGTEGKDENFLADAIQLNKLQTPVPDDIPFPCNVTGSRSSKVPTSVDRLRPGDIDVIACMGDSITAGTGVFSTNIFHTIIESRGASYAAGGKSTWRKFLTLPNILKEFNPNLVGYALRAAPPHDFENAQFNVAEIAAMSRDMPFMAKELIRRMRHHPKVDIKNHWKLIVILIGHNDLCSDICYTSSPWEALENHTRDMVETFRIFRDNLPRTFVALLPPLTIYDLLKHFMDNGLCSITNRIGCSCLLGGAFRNMRSEYYEIVKKWQELDEEIAAYPEFQTDNFAVTFQPMSLNFEIPFLPDGGVDITYVSQDCFHGTQKTHAAFANSLWNNLLEPVGKKTPRCISQPFKKFLCPTQERPYLATWRNSKTKNPT